MFNNAGFDLQGEVLEERENYNNYSDYAAIYRSFVELIEEEINN